ncbi:MAG: O-antigen ligase family protein [Bacilli bacterium]|nr:O-antigen ligase family protein [Bacilli bacterium]
MKLDKNKLIYLFLLLQPFIDLVTSIMTRFEIGFISIGVVIRGLFILFMIIYLLFFCNTKYKRLSILYVFLLGIYTVLYFVVKSELLSNFNYFMTDIVYLFKYMYFLLLFITMFNFYIEYKLEYKKIINIFIFNLFIYSLLILIPYLTNTSFSSYALNRGDGVVGWFFAANDISVIFISLFPFLLYKLNEKISFKYILLVVLSIFSCLLIGTKVAYFGILLSLVLGIFYYLFYIKNRYKNIMLLIIVLLGTILIGNDSSVVGNIKNRVDKYEEYQETGTNITKEEGEIVVKEDDTAATIIVFSNRDKLLKRTYEIYESRNSLEKIFGIGFSNRESVDDSGIEKLVEMDLFDILFHGGIALFILYFLPFIFIVIYFIKYIIKNKFKIDLRGWILGYLIFLIFGVSTLSGHVFSSPSVLIYYTFIVILFLEYFDTNNNLNKKKLSFLMLHLGNGGIEKATVSTANSLSKYFDVELVVAYNLSNQVLYDINDNVKINYLINNDVALRVNKYKENLKKREIRLLFKNIYLDYFKNKRVKNLFIDIFDSIKISFLKNELMIKYLKKCDSDIIISTRVEYSVLLSKYGNKDSKKIAVEHRHHNNDKKYIRKIRNNYNNINYLVVLTEGLRKDYSNFLKRDSKTKVITIPNMIEKYPSKLSSLKNKKVISIGRIVEGKRIDEIIEIASYCKDLEFEIIGDGDKFESMCLLAQNKKVSNVKMLGAMKNEEALEHLKEASIFIMTSETEGLPMVLLEAFSYGVPAICYMTDSGVSDIVDNNLNGFIIEERNQKEMIKKLKEIMNDDKLRKSFGKEALLKAKEFSEKEVIKRWLEIL